ncbi:hypothetical protein Klosneuvirus_4_85 [Klosneuvirus KNV1]|uniref:Uncharacterized protein n=1 Tax=Klosneuvirus KNV1 TaxID=1977640 RepID=A0A1V0SKL7_9VIRU|nr:hypothetical protein Klosneuvirus_4_85 [Klosneuvirus KNV1]
MDFSDTFTLSKIKKWFNDHKDKFEPVDNDIVGYKLNIDRPYWFEQHKKCDKIESKVFTGKSNEEIFIKMYETCLKELTWTKGARVNKGEPVDLLKYLRSFNEELNDKFGIVQKMGDQYIIFKVDDEIDDEIDEIDDNDSEDDDNCDYIVINEANKAKYEPILIKHIINDKMDFYGFGDGGCDCCFSVTELEKDTSLSLSDDE